MKPRTQQFFDVDALGLTPETGDFIRVGCRECSWRSEPYMVLNRGPNAAWRSFQSIDHLFRDHVLDAHPRKPLRLVAVDEDARDSGSRDRPTSSPDSPQERALRRITITIEWEGPYKAVADYFDDKIDLAFEEMWDGDNDLLPRSTAEKVQFAASWSKREQNAKNGSDGADA